MFKIEKHIPIPESAFRNEVFQTLKLLKRGDSFMVPTARQRNHALTVGKRLRIRVTTRKINGKGFRIWRVK